MEATPADPGRRKRWIGSLAIAALISLVVGSAGYFIGWMDGFHRDPASALMTAVKDGANTAAVVFWGVLALLYFTHVRKSAALLDFERRVRLAEDIIKNGYSRTSDSAAEMMRSSTPGAKGTGQP